MTTSSESEPPGVEIPNLGRRTLTGVLVTAAFAFAWELTRIAGGFIYSRFLHPRDYALFGVAASSLAVGGALLSFSIDTRLVQVHGDPAEAYDYGFTLLVGLSLLYVLFALSLPRSSPGFMETACSYRSAPFRASKRCSGRSRSPSSTSSANSGGGANVSSAARALPSASRSRWSLPFAERARGLGWHTDRWQPARSPA